jgi:hypothetical protein
MDRMNGEHGRAEHGENGGNPKPAIQWDQQRCRDHGVEQMRDSERSPVEELALVGQRAIQEPGGGCDWVKIREVWLSRENAVGTSTYGLCTR